MIRRIIIAAALLMSVVSCVHQWPEPADTQVVLHLVYETELPQGPVLDVSTRADEVDQKYDMRYIIEAY